MHTRALQRSGVTSTGHPRHLFNDRPRPDSLESTRARLWGKQCIQLIDGSSRSTAARAVAHVGATAGARAHWDATAACGVDHPPSESATTHSITDGGPDRFARHIRSDRVGLRPVDLRQASRRGPASLHAGCMCAAYARCTRALHMHAACMRICCTGALRMRCLYAACMLRMC